MREVYARFYELKQPHLEGREFTDLEIDIDQEGSHLAGLTERVLKGAELPVSSIELKSSITEALRSMRGRTERERGWIRDLATYHAVMLELAEALSKASGLPVEDDATDPRKAANAAHARLLRLRQPHVADPGLKRGLDRETTYLARLAEGVRTGAYLRGPAIRLDPRLDAGIAAMARATPEDRRLADEALAYRAAMVALAKALGAAAGLPLVLRARKA